MVLFNSIKTRILIPMLVLPALGFGLLAFYNYTQAKNMIVQQEKQHIQSIQAFVENDLADTTRRIRLGIESVVNNPPGTGGVCGQGQGQTGRPHLSHLGKS
ncbi:hypothetical protein [Desulfofundulus thermocisternus]|uniref:hypothetical protein n=1 Tax=Desulfofundulus thermocisternus TaxID=42471 RepID=UPI00217E0D5E|nr:hypothetical protein [Desulfofundulus thermocisternus]MCS5694904.1 hypothetical protein [Desulfofundulus thermocisternus]